MSRGYCCFRSTLCLGYYLHPLPTHKILLWAKNKISIKFHQVALTGIIFLGDFCRRSIKTSKLQYTSILAIRNRRQETIFNIPIVNITKRSHFFVMQLLRKKVCCLFLFYWAQNVSNPDSVLSSVLLGIFTYFVRSYIWFLFCKSSCFEFVSTKTSFLSVFFV